MQAVAGCDSSAAQVDGGSRIGGTGNIDASGVRRREHPLSAQRSLRIGPTSYAGIRSASGPPRSRRRSRPAANSRRRIALMFSGTQSEDIRGHELLE